jgi:two-component system, chemotaxis family, CheB/CheR fusion protein
MKNKMTPTAVSEYPATHFPIVGIGASAGGLEAIKDLLLALPSDTGIAFVLIQHLDPKHESMSADILSRATKMTVTEVKDGMPVEPNKVFVIPPGFSMEILNGILTLLPRPEIRGQHLVIDSFFKSLAEDHKHLAIGVVLSGTGTDGTLGLMAIKSEGASPLRSLQSLQNSKTCRKVQLRQGVSISSYPLKKSPMSW